MKFWTVLQYPFQQAALVENGKIIKTIPTHAPKTIARYVGAVGIFDGKLAVARHAGFELWDINGEECLTSFHSPLIYAPHRIVQYGKDLLICSSGLEMFFIMTWQGDVKWEWWGHENGIGGKLKEYSYENWKTLQVTSNTWEVPIEEAAHFNSAFIDLDMSILTSALRKKKIIKITPGQSGFKLIKNVDEEGCHSPIYQRGRLLYGCENGINFIGDQLLTDYKWVKHIEPTKDGIIFTHEKGVAVLKSGEIVKEIDLPRPFGITLVEE